MGINRKTDNGNVKRMRDNYSRLSTVVATILMNRTMCMLRRQELVSDNDRDREPFGLQGRICGTEIDRKATEEKQ